MHRCLFEICYIGTCHVDITRYEKANLCSFNAVHSSGGSELVL